MTLSITEQIAASMAAHPDYSNGNAYVRTKICCEVMTRLGVRIPSWMVIRTHIDKGSATDIARGVKDWRMEQAEMLQRLNARPEGLPESLTQPMQALWHAALAESGAHFDQERQSFDASQAEAERVVADALAERDAKAGELALAIEKVAGLQGAVDQERARASTERAAREQAERMAALHISDLTSQRQELAGIVASNTQELRTLTARLDDERRRHLLEIDSARQQVAHARLEGLHEGEQKGLKLEAELRREIAALRIEHTQVLRRYNELAHENSEVRAEHTQVLGRFNELAAANAKLRELQTKASRPKPGKARKQAGKALPGGMRRLKGLRKATSA